ncbi:uncharacterized protein LAJ45_02845 [Morchella importuna]|uniref:uncharacterized protein n=1 Tax=Morchella importuna TaxID=1174673 RepID=UPI001E8ED50A|nr:uncharacterized protein LAJ45_02845 [Morchella importuna]KAH8153258.1 hypothetical protein LAJ45_02845 [Morchella importuna]
MGTQDAVFQTAVNVSLATNQSTQLGTTERQEPQEASFITRICRFVVMDGHSATIPLRYSTGRSPKPTYDHH